MSNAIHIETPENIQIAYKPAGLGTRFLAWVVDSLLLSLFLIVLLVLLVMAGAASDSLVRQVLEPMQDLEKELHDGDQRSVELVMLYLIGIWLLIWGLGSFFYYGLSELCLRGHTIGKRASKIRVVKVDGFSLDAVSILVRNIFRVVDHLPVLWIVPLLSAKSQRFGDMVAGTIVIEQEVSRLTGVRGRLSGRSAADSKFRFDAGQLKKLRAQDAEAIERLLERWHEMPAARRHDLQEQIVTGLCLWLSVEPPASDDRTQFLEDLLAAEYRRQARQLG